MKDDLVLDNVKLIYAVLKKMNLFNQLEEYYDVGMIGLVRASIAYDPDKGYAFSTLATRCIKNEILKEVERNKRRISAISFEEPISSMNERLTLLDALSSDMNVEEEYIKKEKIEKLHKAISSLKEKDIEFLKYYYSNETKLSIAEIAKIYSCTASNIFQRKEKILKDLRKIMKDEKEEMESLRKAIDKIRR